MDKPEIQELPQIKDRLSFLYLEHCTIGRDNGAITITDDAGIASIPAATVSVLLLGPGTRITHRAVELAGDLGVSLIWVGEHGVRYYAGGRPLTHRSNLLIKQAELASNQRKHLEVVRKMYEIRFPGEDVSKLTLQQLRGKEGSRMKRLYADSASKWNVEWNGREYDPDNYASGDTINQALSAGHACLYGLAHAVITALGCSPGLGFVHIGHECSFVYDIADLYKAEITIPLAFEVTSQKPDDIGGTMRRCTRDLITEAHIIERMVKDIRYLLLNEDKTDDTDSVLYLWDDRNGEVQNGINYGKTEKWS